MRCRPVAWPGVIQHEEHPDECDQPQLVKKYVRYPGNIPSHDREMRVFYPAFALIELSAGWRYRTHFDMVLSASIRASATFGHSASPDNVTDWHIMALQ